MPKPPIRSGTPSTTMAEKAAFREQIKALERQIPEAQRLESDQALRASFLRLPQLEGADTVLLYYGMGFEVDTRPLLDTLLRRGKRVLLPRCLPGGGMEARCYAPDKLRRHRYGMWEPDPGCEAVEAARIDFVLVPALCYDRQRFRLGRGGGYYDRYLAGYGGFTVGLCRDALLQAAVPREDWDRSVSLVLTETEQF